jgi:hypothetical protein
VSNRTARSDLHDLVNQLPDSELETARRVLTALRHLGTEHPGRGDVRPAAGRDRDDDMRHESE